MIFSAENWYYIGQQSEWDTFDTSVHQPKILWSSDGTEFIAEHIGTPADLSRYVDHEEALSQSQILIDNPEPEDV